jgi:hypothetical protein
VTFRFGRAAPAVVALAAAGAASAASVAVAAHRSLASDSGDPIAAATARRWKVCRRRCRPAVARVQVRARHLAIVDRVVPVAHARPLATVGRAVRARRSAIVVPAVLVARARRLAIVVQAVQVAPAVHVRRCVRVARRRWAPPSASSAMRS